ncbi:NACHT, LRR and PYD domains-containing protein 3-like [Patiria miniata]|uniref:Uncharacterized protein n=1 Tax=Patiria miniata TaxID=46514 RepID=A0A914B2C0_PATMI|nr:NACHT, LRR and PYD domains-containing protein 3-like [Patiria miniata]
MNRTVTLNAFLILLVLLWTPVTAQSQTVFLERGQRGIVSCPLIPSLQIPTEDLGSIFMYWYFGQIDRRSLLISYFLETVTPQNEIPEGVYDIDDTFSLVIENVTDLDAGKYFCEVKPRNAVLQSSNVSVAIKVSPREPFPEIVDCDLIPSTPSDCDASIPYDRSSSLICVVRNAKPAVEIRWFSMFGELRQPVFISTQTVEETVLPPNSLEAGWFLINNTYTTLATIQVWPLFADRYRCEAYGKALGARNGSHMTANIVVAGPPTHRTGTSTPRIEETTATMATMASTTEVPYMPPLVAAVGGPVGGFVFVVVFVIVLLKVRKRRKKNTDVPDPENFPLTENIDLRGLKEILKPLFKAKMQNISVDPSEDQADAMHTDEIFIELELHEKNNTVMVIKSRQQMIGLLGGSQDRRHFVVKGEAGCGKTTLVRRFGFDWANDSVSGSEYMQQFELVFVLKMKDMTDNPGLLSAILSQNIPRENAISMACLRSVIDKVADKVLIILDGWDEMSSKVFNKQAPPGDISVRDILAVQAFTKSCVIVTARPHMMKQLNDLNEEPVFAVIETTGFSDQNRDRYIGKRFGEESDKAEGLIREIKTAAFLEILAKVPIMLRLLCYIWKQKAENEVLPARITALYGRVIDALVKHWEKKCKTSLETRGAGWLEQVQLALGEVAFNGLMDSKEGKLVFPRERFPKEFLMDALALGFFSEKPDSKEPTVTFTHKTFQEYFASFYLVRQTKWFIKRRFLSKVTIDTVQAVEYVLRFSCGMNKLEVASVIFEHVQGIKDELISDRYLWVQHLTLMLYYEAQSDSLEAGVGSCLALKYKEEFAALQYYVDNLHNSDERSGPKVHLERLEVYLHVIKDLTKVKSILEHVDVDSLYYGLLWSDKLGGELEELDQAIEKLPHKKGYKVVCIDQKEHQSSDGAAAAADQEEELGSVDPLVQFCSTKSHVCGFGLRIECDVIKSQDTFSRVATGLGESQAVYFGVLNNSLNGYMSSLKPLIPSLQYLELYDCGLKSDGLVSLAELMPSAVRLRELYISGADFSEEAVESLLRKLKDCPRMLMLELHNTELPSEIIQAVVRESFPEMTPVEGNVEGQYWLQRREKPRCRLRKAVDVLQRNFGRRS